MNANDIISLIIFLLIVGSSIFQSLFKKNKNQPTAKSNKSLSEIKKYLEEMSQGNTGTSDSSKTKPLYTEPYAATSKKKKKQKKKKPSSQRGFQELLETLPQVPEEDINAGFAVTKGGSKNAVHQPGESKRKRGSAAALGVGFEEFNLPSHLNGIQKAIVLTEILGKPKAFDN